MQVGARETMARVHFVNQRPEARRDKLTKHYWCLIHFSYDPISWSCWNSPLISPRQKHSACAPLWPPCRSDQRVLSVRAGAHRVLPCGGMTWRFLVGYLAFKNLLLI